ncbi:MAG: tRNA uridine-5-carboxymethylaminomethyl(34) synthesis GTPase MnmE [Eubacteriaceae bacterium]|nr:tRNA uridine-5-carboxymethylaminomethyl(34) synthesis GTPase MnmE [Eubacteriaceae bacterium]
MNMEDTIAAIATAPGEGGIGIIRISGDDSKNILDRIFVPINSSVLENRKMTYGNIVDPSSKSIIDEVLCVYMKSPKTYTMEDVVEINCHGGMVPLRKTLELVLSNGARMAEPGEFTKRAFLNGRLDLSQAEAVIDVIKAKTDRTYDVALNQLEGVFSRHIKEIRKKLVDVLVNLTVNIDYPDEDIEQITYEKLGSDLNDILSNIENLLSSADTGKIIRDGLGIAIIGKPNVGKSSLMNSLLKETRAIVTEIPGTTRDTIEEHISIKGIPVRLTDTAGIRETDDIIEKIGIEKSKESFNQADLVIFILDSSREMEQEDIDIMNLIDPEKTLILLNKIDLVQKIRKEDILAKIGNISIIETSMHNQMGISEIEEKIVNLVYCGKVSQSNNLIVTNVRHKNILERSRNSIKDAINMVNMQEALEFIEIDVNSTYEALGEIIGETVQDDIINEVFARFCLGK